MFDDRPADPPTPAHGLALDCLEAGVAAADPARAVDRHCAVEDGRLRVRDERYDLSAADEMLIVGGGKGADDLAAALVDLLDGHRTGGVVVTDAHTADPGGVTVRLGEHPRPAPGVSPVPRPSSSGRERPRRPRSCWRRSPAAAAHCSAPRPATWRRPTSRG